MLLKSRLIATKKFQVLSCCRTESYYKIVVMSVRRPDHELSKIPQLSLLAIPSLVGLICCVGALALAPSNEQTQSVWALAPLLFVVPARYLNDTRKRHLEQASTWLYCGVVLYVVLLLLVVGISQMRG